MTSKSSQGQDVSILIYTRDFFREWVKRNVADSYDENTSLVLSKKQLQNGDFEITEILFYKNTLEQINSRTCRASRIDDEINGAFQKYGDAILCDISGIIKEERISQQIIKKELFQSYPNFLEEEENSNKLEIFLCHSSNDKALVRKLAYSKLREAGFDPWFDEEKLLPGQDWSIEIREAVKRSDIVLIFLSKASINKRGYVQKEIKIALDVADEQPEGSIYIIPAKLEDCDIPASLSHLHSVNLHKNGGFDKLLLSLHKCASK